MWEELKVYKQLEKKSINPTFKNFGQKLHSLIEGFKKEQTTSIIKLSRQVNQLEQAVFIEKDKGTYNLNVSTSIKPIDFYLNHKFTMLNIVPLGDIMHNYRRTFYPLTKEWEHLATFLASRIKTEIEIYFRNFNSYNKIIDRREEIEPKNFGLYNKYELLIYAAIKVKKSKLLIEYLDKKIERPVMRISQSQYLKPGEDQIDELKLLNRIKAYAKNEDFASIESELKSIRTIE